MARFQYQMLVLCLILTKVLSSSADLISSTPAASPSQSNDNNLYKKAQTPSVRKLGKHLLSKSSDAPASSPAPASANLSPETEEDVNILEQHIHLKKHHRSVDRSVAGGGVILGGLATTFLVAVFCYIRATARHKGSETSSAAQISS